MVIQQDDEIRIKIVGTRVDATDIVRFPKNCLFPRVHRHNVHLTNSRCGVVRWQVIQVYRLLLLTRKDGCFWSNSLSWTKWPLRISYICCGRHGAKKRYTPPGGLSNRFDPSPGCKKRVCLGKNPHHVKTEDIHELKRFLMPLRRPEKKSSFPLRLRSLRSGRNDINACFASL